jgi:tetratricopeptide (TPR) repeat protein
LRPESVPALQNLAGTLLEKNETKLAIEYLRKAVKLEPSFAWAHGNLGLALLDENRFDEAIHHFHKDLKLEPENAKTYSNLGLVYIRKKEFDRAIVYFRKAIDRNQNLASAYVNWGHALHGKKDLDAAVNKYQMALKIDRNDEKAHYNLANCLQEKGDLDGAIRHNRKALQLKPNLAKAHNNLARALADKRDFDNAVWHYRKALDLDPKYALAHFNFANLLQRKNDFEGAIEHYRNAVAAKPEYSQAHVNLGLALAQNGDLAAAIDHFKKGLAVEQNDAIGHFHLAMTLANSRDLEAAIRHLRKCIEIDSVFWDSNNDATTGGQRALRKRAYNNLGNIYVEKRDFASAIPMFKKAVELDQDYLLARLNLAHALKEQGEFAEALKSYKQAHELGSDRRDPSAKWIQECERLLKLDQELPALLKGDIRPSTPEDWLDYIHVCQLKKSYASQTTLWKRAFTAHPPPSDPRAGYRLRAARAAALAAGGQCQDANKLTEREKADLRQQVLKWLQTDIKEWSKHLEKREPSLVLALFESLGHWQATTDLAGLREEKSLAIIPEPERQEWKKLWAEVASLRKQARDMFRETRLKGILTVKEGLKVHEVKLAAGNSIVIDLESHAFDTFLRLEDASGKKLAENDDVIPGVNLNSRILFTPEKHGIYRLVATAFQGRGVGPYTLTVREFTSVK